MEFPGSFFLVVHIVAGTLTLLTGPVAIFYNFKNPRAHRRVGKVFFYAMLLVCATSVAGYVKRPDQVFFQFLLGIAATVLVHIVRGVRAIRLMRGGVPGAADTALLLFLGTAGLWMTARGLGFALSGRSIAFALLFGIFGFAALLDAGTALRRLHRPEPVQALDWYRTHVGAMLGAFAASTTAFTVNTAAFLPWYLQWFGPILLILPLHLYYGRRIAGGKAPVLPESA